jgi:hypothetical protein
MTITERARPPVDLDVLATWMYERGVGGPITEVRKLGGRIYNIVLQFAAVSGRNRNDLKRTMRQHSAEWLK